MRGRVFEVFLILLAAGVFIYSGVSSRGREGTFELKRIVVKGAAEDKFTSLYGRDLRRVGKEDVLALVSSDPFVGHVEVKKIYPHTLLVNVYRRQPFACMLKDGKEILVDPEGKFIKERCERVGIYFKSSPLPMEFQMKFIRENREELAKFSWVWIRSPFFLEAQLKGRKWRVLLPLKGFKEKLGFLEEILPLLDKDGNFSLVDLRAEGKLYLRRIK